MYKLFLLLVFTGLCNGVSKASECTSQGRYPNEDSENCRGFTMCLVGGVTNFTQYKLNCPVGFVYSHLEQQCTNATNYKCFQSYNCTSIGNFVNSNSKTCRSYIACVEGINHLVSARLIDCPENTIFNPSTQRCANKTENNYCYTKRFDVTELTSLGNNLYDFTDVTFNCGVCFCAKYFTISTLLIIYYSFL